MNTYTAFFIKEEFAYQYFHKTGILFRFLNSYQLQLNEKQSAKQYNYITSHFSKCKLLSHLQKQCPYNISISDNIVTLKDSRQSLSLHISGKQIEFQCETLHTAEGILFPALRTFYPFLFIIEHNRQNYGWISPVSLNRDDNREQVLYSHV